MTDDVDYMRDQSSLAEHTSSYPAFEDGFSIDADDRGTWSWYLWVSSNELLRQTRGNNFDPQHFVLRLKMPIWKDQSTSTMF